MEQEKKRVLENRAFENGGDGLISAKFRSPFLTSDGATLNVECFGSNDEEDDSKWPVLLFIHGVCESAETHSVQHLAVAAAKNQWRLYVLELEGHGLSSGKRAVCGNFSRLCGHVHEFMHHSLELANESNNKEEVVPFAICGTSLGGVLSAYGADYVVSNGSSSNNKKKKALPNNKRALFEKFVGAALVAPAVGVAPEAVPPAPIVGALRVLSFLAPSAGIMTPVEDPTHYACPTTSTRNFSGNWPLSTSKMLLDVTSKQVQNDQISGKLVLDNPLRLLIVAGKKDNIVPLSTVQEFLNHAQTKDKSIVEIPKADHGLLFEKKTANVVMERLFQWLNDGVQAANGGEDQE